MRRLFLALVVLATAAGCNKTPAPAASGSTPPATPAAAAAPAPPKPVPAQLPDVIARVNGYAIQRAEFEEAVRSLEAQAGGPVPAERRDEVYRNVLDRLVGMHLLEQESSARNIQVSDADVEARLQEIRGQFPSEEAFKNALAQQKVSPEQLREETRKQIRIARVLDAEVSSKVFVQPKDVEDFYTKNPDRFREPESVRASHILIVTPPAADEAAKTKARGQAEKLLKQLQGGADFAKLARENSQDTGSAANGGELPPITKGTMVPEFETAAYALQPGQLSSIVQTQYGFHIIKVHEKRQERTVPLAEVRDQVNQFLLEQRRSEQTATFIDSLKSKGKIEILI